MENNKRLPLYNKTQNYLNKPDNDTLSTLNDDLMSLSSTSTTNNYINTTNNFYYSNYKTPKKNVLSIQQNKNNNQVGSKNMNISNMNIYSKGKIKKTIGSVNNIIINNNTNIINNNNTNIINNNFNDNGIGDKEYMRSISQFNMEQIKQLNNKNPILNNILGDKPLIINKKKIIQKNYIHIKNNNIINNNIFSKNLFKSNITTYGNNNDDNKNKNNINNNYNKTENDYIDNNNNNNNNNNNSNKHNYNNTNQNEENSAILNVEELLMIEEKLSSLIKCLVDCNPCREECFEFLNFYFTTKLSKNINKYFINESYQQIIKKTMNLLLFSFILCYDISLHEDILPQYIVNLDELFDYMHMIIILISKYFCNKIIEDSPNIWVKKLQNLIQNYYSAKKTDNEIFNEINILCYKLTDNLYPILLDKYNERKINEIYKRINILSQNDLHRLFIDDIYKNQNKNGSIIASSSYFEENKNAINNFVPVPYLKNKSNKKYTLVLDLDETLIHFKAYPNDDSSGILQFRPFLSEFLSGVNNYYELVVFTAATQDYADPIINAIEQKGTSFDHRLYRIHTRVINNDFVKDLSRLGRDMSRIIIVDNMEQNYKLQPNNGITIRPFWGKDTNDLALFDLLHILRKIAQQNMDVTDGIREFKEDIISRVTSNIFRRVQN